MFHAGGPQALEPEDVAWAAWPTIPVALVGGRAALSRPPALLTQHSRSVSIMIQHGPRSPASSDPSCQVRG
eukprot:15464481-Alexandrium_andersonii.AAC.2